MKAFGWAVVLIAVGGIVRADEAVTITPSNLKDHFKEKEVEVVGQLVGLVPDRSQNKWVFVIRIDGTIPGDHFHAEKKGVADVYVEMRTEADDRKLLKLWGDYQSETRAAGAQKKPAPPEVKVTGPSKLFYEGLGWRNLPRFADETALKASLSEARLPK
jgi:hypothetical protein